MNSATISVDCGRQTPTPQIWSGLGFDEINWTYTPTGRHLLGLVAGEERRRYYIRSHYIFNSGIGRSLPHWGSGNVYHEDASGRPYYDFSVADRVYDAIVEAGHLPLVELGFTPRALVPERAADSYPYEPSPTQYSAYEAGLWSFPPKDFQRWGDLVGALVRHCVDRYGERAVQDWLWELWNEPDISYWRGSVEEYCQLYETTVAAARAVLPGIQVGGPATTGDLRRGGPDFLRTFLARCDERDLPLDFVSFHTKGAHFTPARHYGPVGMSADRPQSPSTLKMLREVQEGLRIVGGSGRFRELPCIIDECDASVPAHWGRFDNGNFAYRNTAYYPVFQCQLMKKLLDLKGRPGAQPAIAMTWSFYMEDERCFEGTRSFLTRGAVEKPLLNAYRMFNRLGDHRLALTSTAAWNLSGLDEADDGEDGLPEEIDGLATMTEDGGVAVLVWRHVDDQYRNDDAPAQVELRFSNLPIAEGSVRVREWRIDGAHSNAYSVWRGLGAPDYPSEEDLAAMRRRQGLEPVGPERVMQSTDRVVSVQTRLPLPSVSLLEVRPL